MNAQQFFLEAIKANAQYDRFWVFQAFSLFRENGDVWKKNPTAYRLVHQPGGYFYVTPDSLVLSKLEADPTKALVTADMPIEVPAGFFEFWPEGGVTTAGNLLFNSCAIWPSVGGKFGYFDDSINVGKIENMFKEMQDTPDPDTPRDHTKLYVDQYLIFCEGIGYLQEFTQLFTIALTAKAIVPPDGLEAKKAEILAKYAGQLNDPLVQTKIYQELVDFDASFLEGDDSEKFLISSKHREQVRRKLFLIFGGEAGLEVTQEIALTANSLSEGWEKETIPNVINNARAGTFSRGTETQDGGVSFKWLVKSTSGTTIDGADCGSKFTVNKLVTKNNMDSFYKLYALNDQDQPVLISDPKQYVGQYVRLRLPNCCAVRGGNYCAICLGDKLNANPHAISLAATSYGGGFLQMKLKAMHGKAHKAAIVSLEEVIS